VNYLAVNTEVIFPNSRDRGSKKLNGCSSFKIESSWQNLSDTAEVVIAKKLYLEQGKRVFELLKAGDPIIIRGGYNGECFDEFKGFISEVLDDLPVMIKCEDNMYVLKRTSCNISLTSTKLEDLLKKIVPTQFKINAMDVELGKVFFSKMTVSQVLLELKDKLGIYSYFVEDTLVSGKIYLDNPNTQKVKYEFSKNIIANDLKYRRKEDIKIKVTMTSYLSNGTKKTVTIGDEEGQEQKLVCSNISNENDIKKLAQKELDRLKIDGHVGTLTGYGIPFVGHGYTAQIINNEYPDRTGNYYVDAVTTTLNNSGAYRRVLKIGARALND
jgi:hypothetical protein